MEQKKYTLTISLLASNRKDTLPKTLNSLKPILDNVSSELIVVDTGCDEELLEIVRQYTDKIVKFEWCKDFAKARNAGLEKAQGEWFMFIDDDEWFEDATEIIEFFNSNEKNKYGSARYLVRNYSNWEGTEWTDAVVGRVFKLFPGTKFVDAVHERMINTAAPTKNFSAYAHHYGYVYRNEEERLKHLQRNISLLEEQVNREPNMARHYAHLAQEYCTSKEYDNVIDVVERGINAADISTSEGKRDMSGLYATRIWALINKTQYHDAFSYAKEYFESDVCNDLGKFMLCEFMALTQYIMDNYQETLVYAEKYFEYKKYFDENPDEKYAQSTIMIMKADTEENILRVAAVAFGAAACLRDEDAVQEYIKYIDFSKDVPLPNPEKCIQGIINTICQTVHLAWCSEALDRILKNNYLGNMLMNEVKELEKKDKLGFYKVADSFAMADTDNGYVNYLRIISARSDLYTERLEKLYDKVLKSDIDLMSLDNTFWMIAADKNINLNVMINKYSMEQWSVDVDAWMVNVKVLQLIERKSVLDGVLRSDNIYMIYFDAAMAEALLLRKRLDNITMKAIREEIQNFISASMKYYKIIYKEHVFKEYPTILPIRCQVAVMLEKLCDGEIEISVARDMVVKFMPRLKNLMDKYEEIV